MRDGVDAGKDGAVGEIAKAVGTIGEEEEEFR